MFAAELNNGNLHATQIISGNSYESILIMSFQFLIVSIFDALSDSH